MKMGIWINSDCLQGLSRLEDKTMQFFIGTVWVARGWAGKICSISKTSKQWELGRKNCAIPKGNWQSVVGSMAVKTMQFPRGIGSQLLGAWQQKLHNAWRELTVNCSSLAAKTTQFLRGTVSWLLGVAGRKNCAEAGRLACWSPLRSF